MTWVLSDLTEDGERWPRLGLGGGSAAPDDAFDGRRTCGEVDLGIPFAVAHHFACPNGQSGLGARDYAAWDREVEQEGLELRQQQLAHPVVDRVAVESRDDLVGRRLAAERYVTALL